MKDSFVLVVEAKRDNLSEGMTRCLLSMSDMTDNNGDGNVFGLITTGEKLADDQLRRYFLSAYTPVSCTV